MKFKYRRNLAFRMVDLVNNIVNQRSSIAETVKLPL